MNLDSNRHCNRTCVNINIGVNKWGGGGDNTVYYPFTSITLNSLVFLAETLQMANEELYR